MKNLFLTWNMCSDFTVLDTKLYSNPKMGIHHRKVEDACGDNIRTKI